MITKSQVMPLLLKTCPGFQSAWREHLAYWGDEEPGAFNDASEFARYLVESYERGDTSEFQAAFEALENILTEGDQEARDIAWTGVLEDIQTIASNHSCGADVFIPWLSPTSYLAWRQIQRTWEGKKSLMDVIRAEKLSK